MKENILGYDVDSSLIDACLEEIFGCLRQPRGKSWLACFNPHSYVVALEDKVFSTALKSANWLLPDGVGVVYASRWFGGKIKQRITGSDVFWGLHERMNAQGGFSVFFLGSTEAVLADIRLRMAQDYPKIRVAGTYSPPFKSSYTNVEVQEIVDVVNASNPDVLWVGMTAPKQEKWIAENIARLNVCFAGAIGAVFDFYTGSVKRSHPVFQRLGFEWLPRLIQEPRRLWRRMFVSAPIFLWHVLRTDIQSKRMK